MQGILIAVASWVLASLITRILVGAGLTLASYAGISALVDEMLAAVTGSFGLIGDSAQVLYMAGVGEAISILGGAFVAAATMYSARLFLMRS